MVKISTNTDPRLSPIKPRTNSPRNGFKPVGAGRSGPGKDIEKTVRGIARAIKNRELVVFCGSGISYNSGLPIVNQLVPYMMDRLGLPPADQRKVMGPKLNNLRLPFEAFIEIVQECSDAGPIYDIFKLGRPNTTHVFLAKLLATGQLPAVITTNFDWLIEKAITEDGNIDSRNYDLLYRQDHLALMSFGDGRRKLIKLHGSVHDPENMAITIRQVAARQLSDARNNIIKETFSRGAHRTVLVLGYSCSDVFDINPQIEAIEGDRKEVILVEHEVNNQKFHAEEIGEKATKNPFREFMGVRLFYDVDLLVLKLWGALLKEACPPLVSAVDWQSQVDAWAENTRGLIPYLISGRIFSLISEQRTAIRYWEEGLAMAGREKDAPNKGMILENLGREYLSRGDYHKMTKLSEESVEISRSFAGDGKSVQASLIILGECYQALGNHYVAMARYREGLLMSRLKADKRSEGKCLTNLGNIYMSLGNYREALRLCVKSLKVAREIGDKLGEGASLAALGKIDQARGLDLWAVDHFQQSLSIAILMKNKKDELDNLGCLGKSHYALGDYHEAQKCYQQALGIARLIEDKYSEGIFLANLGRIDLVLENYHSAIGLCGDSLIVTDFEEGRGTVENLLTIGIAYRALGDYHLAIANHRQALVIARSIGNKQGEGDCLANLGMTYHALYDYPKAIACFSQSLAILKSLFGAGAPRTKDVRERLRGAKRLSNKK